MLANFNLQSPALLFLPSRSLLSSFHQNSFVCKSLDYLNIGPIRHLVLLCTRNSYLNNLVSFARPFHSFISTFGLALTLFSLPILVMSHSQPICTSMPIEHHRKSRTHAQVAFAVFFLGNLSQVVLVVVSSDVRSFNMQIDVFVCLFRTFNYFSQPPLVLDYGTQSLYHVELEPLHFLKTLSTCPSLSRRRHLWIRVFCYIRLVLCCPSLSSYSHSHSICLHSHAFFA
jgi:hypothetical protein